MQCAMMQRIVDIFTTAYPLARNATATVIAGIIADISQHR